MACKHITKNPMDFLMKESFLSRSDSLKSIKKNHHSIHKVNNKFNEGITEEESKDDAGCFMKFDP